LLPICCGLVIETTKYLDVKISSVHSTLETIVADFGDYSRRNGDNLSPNSATVVTPEVGRRACALQKSILAVNGIWVMRHLSGSLFQIW